MDINDIQEQIIDEFASLEDLFDKYEYLIRQGMQMPTINEKYKTEKYAIKSCQSRLWIAAEIVDGKMLFHADSESKIVRGMAAIVLRVVNNQPPDQIAKVDLYFIDKIGLKTLLSPIRANGLTTIVNRINELADQYVAQGTGEN